MNFALGDIVGNETLRARLNFAINDSTLSHAYILEGAKGSGRHTLALHTVASMCCDDKGTDGKKIPCKRCLHCKKIFEGKTPDINLIGLEGDRASVGVDAVRFLKNDIYLPPTDLPFKVYIVDDAEKMTVQAQNAFLLSLEEPPQYVIFFLICETSSPLLETIKSRAPVLRTEKISPSQIEDFLLSCDKRAIQMKESSPEDFYELIYACDGSIGYALDLLDSKKRKSVFEDRQIAKDFINLALGKHSRDKFELVFLLGTKRQDICERLFYVQYALRDLIALKKSDDAPLCFYPDKEYACELATHFTLKKLLTLYSATEIAIDDLGRNSNVRLTLINMLKNSDLI